MSEPIAHMWPKDLKIFETNEASAIAYSVECISPSGETVPLIEFSKYEQLQKERDELEAEARRLETLIDKNNCLVQHSCDQVCADFLKYGKHRHAPNCPTEFFIDITAHRG